MYVVRGKAVFMIYHCVMRGLDGALKPGMCLEVKVEIEDSQKKKRLYADRKSVTSQIQLNMMQSTHLKMIIDKDGR